MQSRDQLALFGAKPVLRAAAPPYPGWSPRQVAALAAAVDEGTRSAEWMSALGGGGPVGRLEEEFCRLMGSGWAVCTNSGYSALVLALLAAGIGPGAEVIVPAHAWPQTVSCVLDAGATPVFADVELATGNLCAVAAASAISPSTAAIIPAHAYGHSADMTSLLQLAERQGLLLIEDCAQALGGRWAARPVGCWGHLACFSFGRRKMICGGEGGLLFTKDRALFERAVLAGQHIDRQELQVTTRGLVEQRSAAARSYRIHPLAAAAVLAELPHLAKTARAQAQRHRYAAAAMLGIPSVQPPQEMPPAQHGWFAFVPMLTERWQPSDRALFVQALCAEGVPVAAKAQGIPVYRQQWLSGQLAKQEEYPNAERRCASEIVLASGASWRGARPSYLAGIAEAFAKVDACLS